MDPILAYFLIALSLALMAGELLLPLQGVLFGLGLTGLVVALAILFSTDVVQGAAALLVLTLVLTTLGPLALRLWQASPAGQRLTLMAPTEETTPRLKQFEALRGRHGQTVSALRPAGVTLFDGQRIDTLSEGPFIEAGQWVRCIDVQAGRVIVRPIETPPDFAEMTF